jgi:hypothetical protein
MSGVPDMAAAAFSDSVMYCSNQFGKPSVTQGKLQTIAKWKTSFGNIIVDTGSALGQHYVNAVIPSENPFAKLERTGLGAVLRRLPLP